MSLQNKLQPFIAKLELDRFYGVRIVDTDSSNSIALNKTAAEMVASHGSVEGYFNQLYTDGVKNIVIQGRKKNGSSWKHEGEPVKIGFEPASEPAPQAPGAPPTHPPAAPPDFNFPGLGSPIQGLNAQVIYHNMRYPELLAETTELRSEVKTLKKEVEKLEKEALQNQFSDAKATGNKEMLSGIAEAAPGIIQAFMMIKGGGMAAPVAPGLAQPNLSNLSEAKQDFIELITHASDTMSDYLFDAAIGINGSEEFGNEFIALLNKYRTQIDQLQQQQ